MADARLWTAEGTIDSVARGIRSAIGDVAPNKAIFAAVRIMYCVVRQLGESDPGARRAARAVALIRMQGLFPQPEAVEKAIDVAEDITHHAWLLVVPEAMLYQWIRKTAAGPQPRMGLLAGMLQPFKLRDCGEFPAPDSEE